MNVPNHERKAFKDMTPEERSAIVEAWIDGGIDFLTDDKQWVDKIGPLGAYSICRTRPRQLVIPWDVIKPEYKWAAMDEDGGVWFFGEKPDIDGDDKYWGGGKGFCQSPLNINTTGIDWRESLVQRPE
jgi:hypothetical protein